MKNTKWMTLVALVFALCAGLSIFAMAQKNLIKNKETMYTLRVARPSDNLPELIRFYRDGLGLEVLASFENHNGFDGVMLGRKGTPYHLEFTHHRGHKVGKAPSQDNLL